MSCNCKKDYSDSVNSESSKKGVLGNLLIRLLMFFISIPILVILFPVMIVVLFNTIVLSKNGVNVAPFLTKWAEKMKKKAKDLDQTTEDDDNVEDYELDDVDVIK